VIIGAAAAIASGLPTLLQVVFSYTSRDFFRAILSARTVDVNKSSMSGSGVPREGLTIATFVGCWP
jgi:hypothetical protein